MSFLNNDSSSCLGRPDDTRAVRQKQVENGFIIDFDCADIPELYDKLDELVRESYDSKSGHNTGFRPETTGLVRIFSTKTKVTPGTIAAFAGYNGNNVLNGLRYICGNRDFPFYREAVEELCIAQIEYNDLNCFAEASEAIEHYFAKNNGDVVPNIFAHIIIRCNANKILEKEADFIHYKREFKAPETASGSRLLRKALFGFGNKAMFEKIQNQMRTSFNETDVQDYQAFKQKALKALEEQYQAYKVSKNERVHELFESCIDAAAHDDMSFADDPKEYIAMICEQFFNNFMDLYDAGFNEFPEDVLNQFMEILSLFERANASRDPEETQRLSDFYRKRILPRISVLKLYQLDDDSAASS